MRTALLTIAALAAYFVILLLISRRSTPRGTAGNDAFFRGGRNSPVWMVAFGMIGASISGVTFISVPGQVAHTGMTYLQMCLGFIPGYAAVAFVLLPLYYKARVTGIYSLLGTRLGSSAQRTGALFFFLSKLTGAAARLYLVCLVVSTLAVSPLTGDGLPQFLLTAGVILALIWGYTRRGGIRTIVRTDALQTACLLTAAVGIGIAAADQMNLGVTETLHTVAESPMFRVWEWDWGSRQAFWRQFLSGAFIVVVMTGLDQDMMQKNLTCRTLREAQRGMMAYGMAFLPVNALFLGLGILLYALCDTQGITPPAGGDELLPWLVGTGRLGAWVTVPFAIGIAAAAFSSADSALTALTTTVCIDLLGLEKQGKTEQKAESVRRRVHLLMVVLFALCLTAFRLGADGNTLNAIYVMASYTYGPLLGLFGFCIFTRRSVRGTWVPPVCILSPVLCALLDICAPRFCNYTFGYELLMLNGLLTFAGLWSISRKKGKTN